MSLNLEQLQKIAERARVTDRADASFRRDFDRAFTPDVAIELIKRVREAEAKPAVAVEGLENVT